MAMQGGLGILAIIAGIAIIAFWGSSADSGFGNILVGGLFIIAGLALMGSKTKTRQTMVETPAERVLMHETKQQKEDVTESLDEKNHVTRKTETETTQKKTEIEEK